MINDNSINLNPDRDLLIELNDYAVEGRYAILHDDLENVQSIFIMISDMVNEAHTIVYEE